MTAPSPPPRRFLRFSLRALFVIETVLAFWLGWNIYVVRQRTRLLDWAKQQDAQVVHGTDKAKYFFRFPEVAEVSTVRRLLGDESVNMIVLNTPVEAACERDFRSVFPECLLVFKHSSGRRYAFLSGEPLIEGPFRAKPD